MPFSSLPTRSLLTKMVSDCLRGDSPSKRSELNFRKFPRKQFRGGAPRKEDLTKMPGSGVCSRLRPRQGETDVQNSSYLTAEFNFALGIPRE
jgi:hypothetical protein